MEEEDAAYQASIADQDFKYVQGQVKRKRKSEEEELDEAHGELEAWRNNPENWIESENKENVISVKRQYTNKHEEATHADEKKIAFFETRFKEFKLFLERRIPEDNEKAKEYLNNFIGLCPRDFAKDIVIRLSFLDSIGGITQVFTIMCNKSGMKAEEFVDKSMDYSNYSEEEKQKRLNFEISDFTRQLKNLLTLAKDLPKKFFE